MKIDNLPDPGKRFTLDELIGEGVCAKVYRAFDTENHNRPVAIKIQKFEADLKESIVEEYRILRDYSSHANLPELYGVYRKKGTNGPDEVWFVLELCEGGSAINLVHAVQNSNRRLNEDHIAYILRETAKALCFLHEHHVIHRDVRGNNILLTKEGEVKICDFGLSKDTRTTYGKLGTSIGSPNWMSPEVITSTAKGDEAYNNRSDVWALGITAIELGDGKPPYGDMHPTRIMFQVVRNPPPTLYRQSNWTQTFNDFIAECLEKDAECRPVMAELLEHPFFTQLPENDYHLGQEIKIFVNDFAINCKIAQKAAHEEVAIHRGLLKYYDRKPQKMYVEDLAALDRLTEDTIIEEICNRVKKGSCYTFVGDVLLAVNANETTFESPEIHNKYKFKSRSENSPHIFAVADSAYQDMLHHEESQHIILSGESYSGKTHNLKMIMKHLMHLGEGYPAVIDRIHAAHAIVHAFTHAGTPANPNSTRCVLNTQMTYNSGGKLSGSIFWVYMLEKLRVSDPDHSNYHIFYYFYDTMEQEERLKDFSLESGRYQRFLRADELPPKTRLTYVRETPLENVRKFKEIESFMTVLDFQADQVEGIYKVLAAILLLGELKFKTADGSATFGDLENPQIATQVAKLLKLDEKKFQWALLNYCVIAQGHAERRRHTVEEAIEARNSLANNIYTRLVDYVVNIINSKLAFGRAIYGDSYTINLFDMHGFECFPRNGMNQLLINSLNEQLQYHYNQRVFVWEMIEQEEEHIPVIALHFYDNKLAVDHLMRKGNGLFPIIDDSTRGRHNESYIIDCINDTKSPYIKRYNTHQFNVAHYTGTVTYDARDFSEKNRDFMPPELVETMRTSTEEMVKMMFTNLLSKTGNLTMEVEDEVKMPAAKSKAGKWGAALVAEKTKARKMNTLSRGQYSQVHKMRTISSVFRATALELMKMLSIGANSGGTHFVRCVRSDLDGEPRGFHEDLVRQQVRAMALLDTARARQRGFPYRIPFAEFLRRYKFLAFDFEENVDISKNNCRLLLLRLKMEGWVIGKSKVFLKYYNVEYLARLYETQVKKIIKVQAMMRAFLAKKSIANKLRSLRQDSKRIISQQSTDSTMSEADAVLRIQKCYRGYKVRRTYGPLLNSKTGAIDSTTAQFISPYAKKWKAKTIFQVLLQYRAARYQDLVNFSQQVHFYNQRLLTGLNTINACVMMEKVNPKEFQKEMLGLVRPSVLKIPFRYDLMPFFDTMYMCDPTCRGYSAAYDSDEENWDAPMRRRKTTSAEIARSAYMEVEPRYGVDDEYLVNEPFVRSPGSTIRRIAPRRNSEAVTAIQSRAASANHHRPNAYSPSPYARATVNDMRDRFNESYLDFDSGKNSIYKKKQAPMPPASPASYYRKGPAPPTPKRDWEPKPRPDFSYDTKKVDPIRELEMIGKVKQDEETVDAPPFNFQGMLRKTNHKRASMKRTDAKLSMAAGINIDIEGNIERTGNVVYQSSSKKERPKSYQELTVTSPTPGPRKYSLQDTGAAADQNANKSIGGLVLEEESFAADL